MVMKRNNRSKTICEFSDEGLFLKEIPTVESCRGFEQSMVMCLLEFLVKFCVGILSVAGEWNFCGKAFFLIILSLERTDKKIF